MMTFRPHQEAFAEAIRTGRLSEDPGKRLWAGNYMYMGREHGVDLFKHVDTREYLPARWH